MPANPHPIADYRRLIQRCQGACLMLFPLLSLAGFLLHPLDTRQASFVIQFIAAHPLQWSMAHILFVAAQPLGYGAALALAQTLHGSRPGLALIAPALILVGGVFFTIHFGSELTLVAMMDVPAPLHAGLQASFQATIDGAGPMPVFMLGLLMNLGWMLLAYGLFRSATLPRWQSLCLALGALLLTSAAVIDALGAVSSIFLLLGMLPSGWQRLNAAVPE